MGKYKYKDNHNEMEKKEKFKDEYKNMTRPCLVNPDILPPFISSAQATPTPTRTP
jgi:hypothetical protein